MASKQSYQKNYFSYLSKRTRLGAIYRNFYLYPVLSKYLVGKLLDVGCGIGDMLAFRKNSIGIDVNQHNIDYCRARGLNAHLIDEGELSFLDGEFDAVLMDNVLEHIENPRQLLVEIMRVLNKDGILLIGVPGLKGFASDLDHKVYYDEDKLTDLASSLGFKVKKFFYMPLIKSNLLSRKIKQYTIYCLLIKE